MNKIGTLAEKSLHSYIKSIYTENGGECEKKIGSYFADVFINGEITEIQTRDFYRLLTKIRYFLGQGYRVTVTLPIPRKKWLVWIDPETGETTKKRRSPKIGSALDILPEIYGLRMLLPNPALSFEAFLVDVEQYKSLDGWSRDRKKGASSVERFPLYGYERILLSSPADFASLLPENLPEAFTSLDFSLAAKKSRTFSQRALNVMAAVGAVSKMGKIGNNILYTRVPDNLL